MQYSRVLLVALAAALVARFWAGPRRPAPGAPWLAPVHWGNLAAVLLLAALGQQVARLLRLQAWALLGPMLLLSALHAGGWLVIDLPRWLLAAAYALLGWHIGLDSAAMPYATPGRPCPSCWRRTVPDGFCGLLAVVPDALRRTSMP